MDRPTETEIPTETGDEPFLGPVDIVLLLALLAGAAWWLLKNKKKVEPAQKSYSIQ